MIGSSRSGFVLFIWFECGVQSILKLSQDRTERYTLNLSVDCNANLCRKEEN